MSSSPATWPASWPPRVSKTGHIAAVGGTAVIPAVVNYIEGYANGAKSINPDAVVTVTYVSGAPDTAAFNDPAGGQAIAQQLLAQDPDIDVMFQVAGKTGNGVLQAACDAGIYAIGVDVDQFQSTPETAACTIVSAEKKLTKNRRRRHPERIAAGTDLGGILLLRHHPTDRGHLALPRLQEAHHRRDPRTPWPLPRPPSPTARCRPAKRRKAPASACRRCRRQPLAGAI